MEYYHFKSGSAVPVVELIKKTGLYSFTVRIAVFKRFITKVLVYIAGLNHRIKFVGMHCYVLLSDESLLT